MATVKKGNGTTKRRRTKAAGAGPQAGAEKSAAAAKQSNTKRVSKTSATEAAAIEAAPGKPAAEPAAEPLPSAPAMKPVAEPAPSKPIIEPVAALMRNDLAPAKFAPEVAISKPAKPDVEAIRVRAYHLFLARGGTHGDDLGDWLAAERQLIGDRHA